MDETTTTLSGLLDEEDALIEGLTSEARFSYENGREIGRRIGRIAMREERDSWHQKATHDKLTSDLSREGLEGALNREGLDEYLDTAQSPKAALLVDATNFKAINDNLGYSAGDQVIVDTYELLYDSVRPGDQICRWGGDEFVIILNGEEEPAENPNSPMAFERRMQKPSHVEYIGEVKERIAERVKEFLLKRPELQSINFDLAVGGRAWVEGIRAHELVDLLKQDMDKEKALQHEKGQHRP